MYLYTTICFIGIFRTSFDSVNLIFDVSNMYKEYHINYCQINESKDAKINSNIGDTNEESSVITSVTESENGTNYYSSCVKCYVMNLTLVFNSFQILQVIVRGRWK